MTSLARGARIRIAVTGALLAVVLFALPPLLSLYWIDVLTAVAIYSVVALGLSLLMGRVRLVSPIVRLTRRGVADGWFTEHDAAAAERDARAAVAAAVEFARASPFPPVDLVEELVYA